MEEMGKPRYVLKVEVPYGRVDLELAFLGLLFNEEKLSRLSDEKKISDMINRINSGLPKDEAELNKKIADYYGISLENFLANPNYLLLKDEYSKSTIAVIVETMARELDLTEKEIWSLWAKMFDLI